MSLFKIKNNRQVITDNRITLDAKHSNITNNFKNENKNINDFKNDLKKYKFKIDKLKKKSLKKLTLEELDEYYKLDNKINDLKSNIRNIKHKKNEYNYYLNTADVLYKYYSIDSTTKTGNTEYMPSINNKKSTIVDFFKEKPQDNKNIIKKPENINKATLLNNYLKTVDKNSYKHTNLYTQKNDNCPKCNVEKY